MSSTMTLTRRRLLHMAGAAAALPVISGLARAQSSPTRPVRLVVGYPPGGSNDTLARLITPWLSERLGQPFIIENRPGAGNNIATEAVVRAPADGHTLLVADAANAINATLYDKLTFNFSRDIAPIAGLIDIPLVMSVNPSLPVETVPEFIAYAKANPGKVSMASAGHGHPSHVSGELFKSMTGVDLVHVPYRGGAPALTDLLGGQVQVFFGLLSTTIEYIKAGKVRALAVTSPVRARSLPQVPAVGEFVKGYEATSWFGIGAPSNTPAEIINRLNRETNAALADPKIKSQLTDLGGTTLVLSPADFGEHIVRETEKWSRVIRAANIKPA